MNARPILGLLLMTAAIMIPLYAAAQNDTATLSEIHRDQPGVSCKTSVHLAATTALRHQSMTKVW